jgi:hypothetical protein
MVVSASPSVEVAMRAFFVAVSAILLIVVGFLLPVLLPRPSPVTVAAFDRIEMGMTQKEVETILGGPPGDYRTGPTGDYKIRIRAKYSPGAGTWPPPSDWQGDEGVARFRFDAGGNMIAKEFLEIRPRDEGPGQKLLWRLERLKERFLKRLGR